MLQSVATEPGSWLSGSR